MIIKWRQLPKTLRLGTTLIPIILAFLVVGVVSATPSPTINTDDGQVDGGWGSPLYTSTTNNPGIDDDLEIKNAWFQNNGQDLNFRIETWAGPAVRNTFIAVGVLDCNSNSTPNGNPDRNILFNTQYDIVTVRSANNSFLAYGNNCGTTNPPNNPPCPDCERTSTPDNKNLEWKLVNWPQYPTEDDYAFPADCRDQIQVKFAITNSSGGIISETPYFGWNIPTVVEMKAVTASNRTATPLGLGFLGLVVLGGLGALVVYRRKRKS